MEIYDCKCCSFVTDVKYNFKRHLKSNKHINKAKLKKEVVPEPILVTPIEPNNVPDKLNDTNKKFCCDYCKREFTMKNAMVRHMKERCNENKDKNLSKLVKIMNKESKKDKETIANLQKQIDKMGSKLEININTTNIQNNFTLLPYDKTDYSHLTDNDYVSAIKKVNFCIHHLIEKVHFNPEKPENMNIYISNIIDKYLMMYEDGAWNIKQKDYHINEVLIDKQLIIAELLEKAQHNHHELID